MPNDIQKWLDIEIVQFSRKRFSHFLPLFWYAVMFKKSIFTSFHTKSKDVEIY